MGTFTISTYAVNWWTANMWCKKQGKYLADSSVVYNVASQLKNAGISQGWTSSSYNGGSGYSLVKSGYGDLGTCQAVYYNYNNGSSSAYMGYNQRTSTYVAICWSNGTYYY